MTMLLANLGTLLRTPQEHHHELKSHSQTRCSFVTTLLQVHPPRTGAEHNQPPRSPTQSNVPVQALRLPRLPRADRVVQEIHLESLLFLNHSHYSSHPLHERRIFSLDFLLEAFQDQANLDAQHISLEHEDSSLVCSLHPHDPTLTKVEQDHEEVHVLPPKRQHQRWQLDP